jgi:hypothetical protein
MASAEPPLVILVPYRDRREHLQRLVPALDRHLAVRGIEARIVIVHQADRQPFNKGALLNAGFAIRGQTAGWICLHDVDMLPDADNAADDYARPEQPTHLAGHAEQFQYAMPYPTYFGGAIVMPTEAFRRTNGFSNDYWGWGREDDDFFLRVITAGFPVLRKAGRYQSLPHPRAQASARPNLLTNTNRLLSTLLFAATKVPRDQQRLLACAQFVCNRACTEPGMPIAPESDGLSTVQYQLVARMPLVEFPDFAGTTTGDHEVLEVTL